MGDNNKKYSGFGYVVNPTRMWYNKRLLKWDLKDLIFTSIFKTFQKCELFLKKERD